MRKETVVLTNFYGALGGGEIALLAHARWLRNSGIGVDVLLFRDGQLRVELENLGCRVWVLPHRLDYGLRGAVCATAWISPGIGNLLRRVAPRYAIVYTLQEMPFVAMAGKLAGVPVFYRDQGQPCDLADSSNWRARLYRPVAQHLLKGVLPTTKAEADAVIRMGLARDRVECVYLGGDTSRFKPLDGTRISVFAELGLPQSCRVIGIFGRLTEVKGHRLLFNAVARGGFSDVHVLVVGGGQLAADDGRSYRASLDMYVGKLGIRGRVTFTGFRSDVPRLMNACDVIVNASRWEPFGLVLVEAMLCGKPIVAPGVSGPNEIVLDGETGYLFTPNDAGELASWLGVLLGDERLRMQLGRAGRERALKLFDMTKNLTRLHERIRQWLGG